jgi:protein phosphatase
MPEWMVESSQLSDVGQKRKHNEDYVGFYEPFRIADQKAYGRLYVLADGVGGATAGDVASKYTVNKIIYSYYQGQAGDDSGAAVIRGDALIVANVGDSRAYVIRGDSIEQITEDHSLIAEMLNDGVINAEQAATHPYRNVILRSVGAYETVQVDLFARQIAPEDILVLCSDGLTHLVSNQELVDIVGAHSPAEAAQSLVALANERGGDDNISVSITYISHEKMEGDIPGTGQLPDTPRWEDLQHP